MNRDIFVGRERELGRLREAFEAACRGEARVVAVAGEPGIGKTRLAEELERHAREQGALVLWGRVRETAGAPPYWPWIQVGRALGDALSPADLAALLGRDAAELQRLFPELRDLLPDLPPAEPALEGESARFRLFEAVTSVYRRLAAQRPVLLVLDDLHWADAATLLLLQHLTSEVAGSRLMLLLTYREGEVERDHPLGRTVGELSRLPGFESLTLYGLNEQETAQYVRQSADVAPATETVRRIYEVTEGNPFFTREVVRLLAEREALGSGAPGALPLTAGVRAVLGRHLERLSNDARELLRTAAIVGREFTHDTLALLAESGGIDLVPLLEEALGSRVIEETEEAGRYRFVHALMHETLLSDIAAPRRALLHQQVGEALERRWGERVERYAARLALHFIEAAPLGIEQADKAVHYSRLAGEQAEAQFAWGEATEQYERSLTLLEAAGQHGTAAGLIEALGRCQLAGSRFRPAWRSLMRASDLYRVQVDWPGLARATALACEIFIPIDRRRAILDAALGAPGEREPALEARLLAHRAIIPSIALDERLRGLARARTIGQASPHADLLPLLDAVEGQVMFEQWRVEESATRWRAAVDGYEAAGLRLPAVRARMHWAAAVLAAGDLVSANAAYEELLASARRVRSPSLTEIALGNLAQIALLRADQGRARDLRGALADAAIYSSVIDALLAESTGEPVALEQVLVEPALAGGFHPMLARLHGIRARALYRTSDVDGARRELGGIADATRGAPGSSSIAVEIGWAEPALIELADANFIRTVYDDFARADECRVAPLSLDAFRGALALRLDLVDEAEHHFRTGAEWCERERCPVELGRCLLGLAEVAELRGQREETMAHLDRAGELFEQYGAKLYLDDARAMRERIEASSRGPVYPNGLSEREVEVLRLAAAGKSNREIAEELVLSTRTVERHVANAYNKAGLHSRAEAATYALRHGLLHDDGHGTA